MNDTAKRFLPPRVDFATFKAKHFLWEVDGKVGDSHFELPEGKNPLTLDSYAESARYLPRPRLCRRYQERRDHRSGGQLLLRWRRARNYRPASRDAAQGRYARPSLLPG